MNDHATAENCALNPQPTIKPCILLLEILCHLIQRPYAKQTNKISKLPNPQTHTKWTNKIPSCPIHNAKWTSHRIHAPQSQAAQSIAFPIPWHECNHEKRTNKIPSRSIHGHGQMNQRDLKLPNPRKSNNKIPSHPIHSASTHTTPSVQHQQVYLCQPARSDLFWKFIIFQT